jgi:hypothetical protein
VLPGLAYGLALAVRPRTIRGVPAAPPTVTARPCSADGRYSRGAIAPDGDAEQSLPSPADSPAGHRVDGSTPRHQADADSVTDRALRRHAPKTHQHGKVARPPSCSRSFKMTMWRSLAVSCGFYLRHRGQQWRLSANKERPSHANAVFHAH